MGALDDYAKSQALGRSAVRDLIDASTNPLWKSIAMDAVSHSVVDSITSAMPLMQNNSVSRIAELMGPLSTMTRPDVSGLLAGLEVLESPLKNMKSLTENWSVHTNALGMLANAMPPGLQTLGLERVATSGISALGASSISMMSTGLAALGQEMEAQRKSIASLYTSMPGVEYAVSAGLSDALNSILESAEAFDREYGGTEVEETANEFLDDHAVIAEQMYGSPFLRTLTLRQRRMVAAYLAFLVYIVFVSAVTLGDSAYPEFMHVLEIFGIDIAPLASGAATYKGSKKVMDRYLADHDED